jgi:HD-GYP domain-containing protein (c-di-GMP phosphodiesterase class II)
MSPDIVQALVKAIELKDACTAAHTWRVVLYTRALAEEAGLDHALIGRLTFAAALHDLGKIDVPDEILRKPGSLTDEEFQVMKTHTTLGHERLLRMGEDDPVLLDLVRHHHERWDGRGYPDGLAGEAIPLGARYFAVIDSFDAMTSRRPYRPDAADRLVTRALAELEMGAASRYDPRAVEMFTRLYRTGRLDWIHEHFNDAREVESWNGRVAAGVRFAVSPGFPPGRDRA